MTTDHQKLSLLILLLFSFEASAFNTIKNITFEGNETTQTSVFQRLLRIREGDAVDVEKIAQSVQSIMDLGLYKEVVYALRNNGDDYDLIITVREKHFVIILPLLRYRDNQWHKGGHLRFDNLFGLTHQLKYTYEDKGIYFGTREIKQSLSYVYPWFMGTKQTLDLSFISENTAREQSGGGILNDNDNLFILGSTFWLNPKGIAEGPYISIGAETGLREQVDINTDLITDTVSATSLNIGIGIKQTHIHKYNRSGKEYGYRLSAASSLIGSETTYYQQQLFYKSYYVFPTRPGDNLNVYALIGHSTDDILNEPAFTLGSRSNLRGYENDRFKGNATYFLDTEYMTPSSTSPKLRYIAFIDIGSTADSISTLLNESVKVGVGFGIRWKFPAFVNLDISIDAGYGIDDRTTLVLFSTHHVF